MILYLCCFLTLFKTAVSFLLFVCWLLLVFFPSKMMLVEYKEGKGKSQFEEILQWPTLKTNKTYHTLPAV